MFLVHLVLLQFSDGDTSTFYDPTDWRHNMGRALFDALKHKQVCVGAS